MEFKDNCFTLIRYIIAFDVVFQHASVCGLSMPHIPFLNWIDAVPLFYFISAYLIMYSLDTKKENLMVYTKKRILRLYPELWISIILEFILFAVQFPNLLTNVFFYLWIFAQVTFFQFWTPDCLRFYGIGTPNGSLWTISVFVQFYILAYFIKDKVLKTKIWQDILILLILISLNSCISFLEGNIGEILFKLILQTIVPYLYMFYFGILFYKYRKTLMPIGKKYFIVFFVIYILAGLYNSKINFIPHTSNTACVIHVLICCTFFYSFAYTFHFIKIKKDYSYGIYVYHMIVMNFFLHHNLIENHLKRLNIIYIITFILAIISSKLSKEIIKKLKVV